MMDSTGGLCSVRYAVDEGSGKGEARVADRPAACGRCSSNASPGRPSVPDSAIRQLFENQEA